MMKKPTKLEFIPPKKENKKNVITFRCSDKHYQMLKENAKSHGYDKLGTWALFAALNFQVIDGSK